MSNEEFEYNHFLKNLFSSQPGIAMHIFYDTHVGYLQQVILLYFTKEESQVEDLLIRVLIRIGHEMPDYNPFVKLKLWLCSKVIQEALRMDYGLPMDLLLENLNWQAPGLGMRMQMAIDRIFEGNSLYEARLKGSSFPLDICG